MPDTTANSDRETAVSLSADELLGLIENIEQSGVLGRSKVYVELLRYIAEATVAGALPKEMAIAIDVLGKGADFDVSSDSLVRVYIHKLRQKLDSYYANQGQGDVHQLRIPKGQYTLQVIPRQSAAKNENPVSLGLKNTEGLKWLLGLVALLLLGNLIYLFTGSMTGDTNVDPRSNLIDNPVWQPILDDDHPVVLVVGDYYIFAEDRGPGKPGRLIREYDINSPRDLGRLIRRQVAAGETSNYYNLNLTYSPRGSVFALQDILPILTLAGKEVSIRMSSEVTGADFKSQHVIYIGYIGAMRELENLAFAGSNFAVGNSYDQLIQLDTGEIHSSSEFRSAGESGSFNDLGFLSSSPLPDGYQLMIIAGTRDTGLMHMAQMASGGSLKVINEWLSAKVKSEPISFETLYQVQGFDGTNFDAEPIYIGEFSNEELWHNKKLKE